MSPEAKRDVDKDEVDDEDYAFLGREFLTWLLWRADIGEAEWDEFVVSFGGKVRLQGVGGDVTDAVLKGRSAALGVETRAGIGAGRTLREAELRLSTEDREWRFTLVADTLDWKSVKLPTQLDKEDEPVLLDDPDGKKKRPKKKRPELEIDPLTERMELLAQLDLHMTTVFQSFLSERTRPAWTRSTVPALRDWLVEGIAVE